LILHISLVSAIDGGLLVVASPRAEMDPAEELAGAGVVGYPGAEPRVLVVGG